MKKRWDDLKQFFRNLPGTVLKRTRDLGLFISSPVFLKNLGLAILTAILLIFLTFKFLQIYTRHGESITLPDFTGMSLDKVEQQLKNKHLKFDVIDSLYTLKSAPGTVLDQDPPPNSKVKEKRTIYFTINATQPPDVPLPNIWNRDFKFARKMLESRGLLIDDNNITYKKDKAENTILEVIYEGETLANPGHNKSETKIKLPKGSKVGLVVAEGGGGEVTVPKLTCYTYEEVVFKIRSSNLNLGVVIPDNTVSDKMSAFVYRQSPTFGDGQTMPMGEQVDIWLTQDRPAGCSEFDLLDEDLFSEDPDSL